jgi:cytochrome c554/c'-like protein
MRSLCWPALAAFLCACHSSDQTVELTRDQLLDPQTCQGCHQDHYAEWAGSMHAYASNDPVFIAMNKRGQRETGGALGKFCVNCHAPLAVREGLTTDGLNLDQVPQQMKGITCYFCHSVQSVEGTHDNPLTLASDGVLRGAIADPSSNGRPHGAAYSPLLDRDRAESSTTCGSCHDIVNGHGTAIERTFSEWNASAFKLISGTTCGQCHMPQSTDLKPIAQVQGAPPRRAHGHTFPGVDLALTPFPDTQRQHDQVQALLQTTLQTAICVQKFGNTSQVSVIMDNVAAGHSFPSGAEQDRRAYVELTAYSGSTVLYQSGAIADGVGAATSTDPDLWMMRDCIFDDAGKEVHMFWEAASYENDSLPALITFDPGSPDFYKGHRYRFFPRDGSPIGPPGYPAAPDRITLRVRMEAVGYDVVDNLIASGDLDPAVRSGFSVLDVGAQLEWTQAAATHTYLDRVTGNTVFCATDTNLNVTADKFPATVHTRCSP